MKDAALNSDTQDIVVAKVFRQAPGDDLENANNR
jgi:hypothetical protein